MQVNTDNEEQPTEVKQYRSMDSKAVCLKGHPRTKEELIVQQKKTEERLRQRWRANIDSTTDPRLQLFYRLQLRRYDEGPTPEEAKSEAVIISAFCQRYKKACVLSDPLPSAP